MKLFLPSLLLLTASVVTAQTPDPSVDAHAPAPAPTTAVDPALQAVEARLAANPQDVEARFQRGVLLVKLGQSDAALQTFNELVRDFPALPEVHNNIAVIHAQRGDYEQARVSLLAAQKARPNFGPARENLADVYTALGLAEYAKAQALDSDNEVLARKLTVLTQLACGQMPAAPECAKARAAAEKPDAAAALDATQAWATAWSARDVDAYLAAYAPSFKPESGISQAAWKAERRQRIRAAGIIRVSVQQPQVSESAEGVTVRFRQLYTSDQRTITTQKVLEFQIVEGAWKIVREYSR